MTRQETQIVTTPELIAYPFTFDQVVSGQGYQITVTFPDQNDTPDTVAALLQQGKTSNPAQVAAAKAAGNP